MPLLPTRIARSAWLDERRRGIGGSDALAVMGLHHSVSAYEVWADKLNLLPPKAETAPMVWGRLLEPVIASYFAAARNIRIRRAGLFAHPEHNWMRYTPDRLTGDGGILEVKTTSVFNTEDWAHGAIPEAAEAQARHGMAVLDRDHAWIIALIGGQRPVIRRITRDRDLEANLIAIEHSFWHQHVLTRHPPHPDGSSSCAHTLYELYRDVQTGLNVELNDHDLGVLDELSALKEQAKGLRMSIAELENWIKHRLEHAETGTHRGRPVVTWRECHRAEYTVAATRYRQLRVLQREK
ncbi:MULTISPECIES: lambda-exonuclease family protein [unclassified Crossiella]|uniref:YqaJ viral recombinase family nuclease n=1 Tax=unclassified Crossiella TaxID=2620835 RepID=UPI001FFF2BEE|nr:MULTISPECIES: YqaJ viral recombinase family protein [unclassified Crossiella]MCK2240964.1 YqaJ viral recombinase family protein [Crossiella sp. S99.2]MCK2253892.1 YqaJ viral recombinase family protein [Crossiella sp. S99.1]